MISRTDALQPDQAADEVVRFSLDGVDFEIALCAMNAHRLREILMDIIPFARRQGTSHDREHGRTITLQHQATQKVRAWAVEQGLGVGARGRVRDDVFRAYVLHHRQLELATAT